MPSPSPPRALLVVVTALLGCGDSTPSASINTAPPLASASAPVSAPAPASAAPPASASSDALTGASQKYEPGPSVLTSGSVDGAALRKRHVERLSKDTSPVTVLQGQSPIELGRRICEAVAPKRPPQTPVLLKPNLCGFDSIKDPAKHNGDDGVHGRTTDVGFTRGVVQCLKARGHTKITIAEGCGISHKHWESVIVLTGYDVMAREEGVSLVAMDDDGVFDVEGDQPGKPLAIKGIGNTRVPTLLLPKILAEHLDHGLFLSLPKIKAHRYAVVSLGIKGMQGTVMLSDQSPAYKQKWRMHKELGDYEKDRKAEKAEVADGGTALDPLAKRRAYVGTLMIFAERMVDTLEISTPDAVLADGAPAMGGDGFQAVRPSAEMVAIGGTNPVLVDRVGAAFLGVYDSLALARELGGHKTSPLIEVAAKRYKLDLGATVIQGDGARLLEGPRPVHFKSMNGFAIDSDPPGVSTPLAPNWAALAAPKGASPAPTAAPEATGLEAPAPSADPAPPPQSRPAPTTPSGKPEVHAAALGSDTITLDGSGADGAWARAATTSWDTDYAGVPSRIGTQVRFLWAKDGLYALFDLSSAGLFTDTARPTTVERKGLYQEDCVEIFLTPDPAKTKHYFEIELGPFGHYFDLDVDREHHKEDIEWSSGAIIATRRSASASTATIEVKLTAPAITAALAAGARLPLGLYRMEGKTTRRYLAWSPPRTAKPNFHVPEAFGALILDP
ncbi:MAG: DUF362 domain-containing protein [Minicystis sp.]